MLITPTTPSKKTSTSGHAAEGSHHPFRHPPPIQGGSHDNRGGHGRHTPGGHRGDVSGILARGRAPCLQLRHHHDDPRTSVSTGQIMPPTIWAEAKSPRKAPLRDACRERRSCRLPRGVASQRVAGTNQGAKERRRGARTARLSTRSCSSVCRRCTRGRPKSFKSGVSRTSTTRTTPLPSTSPTASILRPYLHKKPAGTERRGSA